MMRLLHLAAIVGLIGSAAYAYSIKYDTLLASEKLLKLKSQVQREREGVAVLKAEWQLLNRPERLQAAADRYLPDIRAVNMHQLGRFQDLPAKPERTDEIAKKLEALSLAEPTATPRERRPSEARTPSTTPKAPAR